MGGNWVISRTLCKKIGVRTKVLNIRNTYTLAEDCSGNNHESQKRILELSLVPVQCISSMGGNRATSCKKICARRKVLTIRNTYTLAEDCSGNNH